MFMLLEKVKGGKEKMKEAKKAENALIQVNRAYLMEAMQNGDNEYMQAFNEMMKVLRRLQE